MAVTDLGQVGTNNNKTSGTTLAVTASQTIPAGTFLICALTFDNHASTTAATLSLSASGGGTWTQRGTTTGSGVTTTAGAGIWGAVFTTKTTSQINSGATITTVTFGSAVIAKIGVIVGFQGVDNTLRNTVASGTSTAGTPSAATTGTALVAGDLVVGTIHGENNATPGADTDTLNGAWGAVVGAATTGSSANTNVCVGVQDKEVNATGAQTYNGTTSNDAVAFVFAMVPSPVTAVQKNLSATTWNVDKAISVTRAVSWNTDDEIAVTRAASWNVDVEVQLSWSTSWNTDDEATITRSTSWDLHQTITIPRAASWNVLEEAQPVPDVTRTATWDVLTTVALSGPPPFNPGSLTGLRVWFDASQLGADGTAIDPWPNLAAGGVAGGIVGTPPPAVKANGLNGKKVARFKVNEGRVRMTSIGVHLDFTGVYVARMTGGTNGRILNGIYSPNNILWGWWNGEEDVAYDTGTAFLEPNNHIAATTNWKMYSFDGSNTVAPNGMRLYSDGAVIRSKTGYTIQGLGGTLGISGYDPTLTQETSDCEVAEVILYDRVLSDTDRATVEDYLRTKWLGAGGSTGGGTGVWRVLASVPIARTTSWNVAATAAVTVTRTASWDTVGTVSLTRTATWDALKTVGVTRVTPWDVLRGIAVTRAGSWDTTTPVGVARATTWDVTSPRTVTRAGSWRVQQPVTVARATTFRVRQAVAPTRSTTWDVLTSSSTSRSTSWDVTVAIAAARAGSWDVLASRTVTRAGSWDTLAGRTATRATTWNQAQPTQGAVNVARATTWKVRAAIVPTRTATWDVLTPVATSKATTWDVLTGVTRTRTSSWHTRSAIAPNRSTSWRVRAPVASSRLLLWDTTAVVARTRAASWDVTTKIQLTRSASWDVLTPAAAARATSWQCKASVSRTRLVTWDTLTTVVSAPRTTTWNVLIHGAYVRALVDGQWQVVEVVGWGFTGELKPVNAMSP